MLATVIEILNYVTISQLLLFCIFFLINKQGNLLSNKLLAFLFLCYAFNLFTYYSDYHFLSTFMERAPRLIWFFEPFSFCIGPLLFLYTMSLVRSNFKLRPIHFAFFIPFLIYLMLTITKITIQSPDTIRKLATAGVFLSLFTYVVLYTLLRWGNLTLAILSIVALLRYKKQLKSGNQHQARFDVKWQLIVLTGFSIVFVIEAINYIYYYRNFESLRLRDGIFFVMFFIFNSLIFTGLKNKSLYKTNESIVKYSKSPLIPDAKELLLQKIRECMVEEKYFLTPSITLQDVAEKINSQPRLVSQVINELSDQNFIDFVNTYRIEEAKRMLIDPKYRQFSILGILFESGFNSKTAFNTAFKKQTGCTPKEFKLLNEQNI